MAQFKPELFRLHVTHRTANQLRLESGVASKSDALRKYRQDFLQLPSIGGILLVLGLIGNLGRSLNLDNASGLESQMLMYFFLFFIISVVLGLGLMLLTADFYVCWILDRRSNELVHVTQNFLETRKKRYCLSDFQGVKILHPKKTFLNQYVLTLVRQDRNWLALERQSITEEGIDPTAQRHQDLARTICEFMRWSL